MRQPWSASFHAVLIPRAACAMCYRRPQRATRPRWSRRRRPATRRSHRWRPSTWCGTRPRRGPLRGRSTACRRTSRSPRCRSTTPRNSRSSTRWGLDLLPRASVLRIIFHPEIESCGNVSSRLECLFTMTLQQGCQRGARGYLGQGRRCQCRQGRVVHVNPGLDFTV